MNTLRSLVSRSAFLFATVIAFISPPARAQSLVHVRGEIVFNGVGTDVNGTLTALNNSGDKWSFTCGRQTGLNSDAPTGVPFTITPSPDAFPGDWVFSPSTFTLSGDAPFVRLTLVRGPISGTVSFHGAGTRVTVRATWKEGANQRSEDVVTDDSGAFRFNSVPAVATVSVVTGASFTQATAPIVANPGTSGLRFAILRGTIAGSVVFGDQPIVAGLEFSSDTPLSGQEQIPATTDTQGRFVASNLPTATYSIRAVKPGYSFAPAVATANLTDTVKFQVSSAPIAGRISDGLSGAAGVTVTLKSSLANGRQTSVITDAQGYYRAEFLPAGDYDVIPGTTRGDGTSFVPSPNVLRVAAGTLDANFAAGYSISGRILSETGQPIYDVTLEARSSAQTNRIVASTGSYQLSLLPGVFYTIQATRKGYGFQPAQFTRTLNASESGVDLVGFAAVTGRVTRQGIGLAGVTVEVVGQPGKTIQTDDSGYYALGRFPTTTRDKVSVRLTSGGSVLATSDHAVLPGSGEALDFDLQALFPGRITFADGSAAAGVVVEVRTNASCSLCAVSSVVTDADGRYLASVPGASVVQLDPVRSGYEFSPASLSVGVDSDPGDFQVIASPPGISSINDQFVDPDSATELVQFSVSDREQPAEVLTLSYQSSNPLLLPNGAVTNRPAGAGPLAQFTGVQFGGVGATRWVVVRPAAGQRGTATVTVRVSDGLGGLADTSFQLNVGVKPRYNVVEIQGPAGMPETHAHGINDAGMVVGYVEDGAGINPVAAYSLPSAEGRFVEITGFGPRGAAHAVSPNGLIGGVRYTCPLNNWCGEESLILTNQAVIKVNGSGSIRDINASGYMVKLVWAPFSALSQLVHLNGDGSTTVSAIAGLGYDYSVPAAINNPGQIVGYSIPPLGSGKSTAMFVASAADPTRVVTSSWSQQLVPYDISDSGKIVGHTGVDNDVLWNGEMDLKGRAFLTSVSDPTVVQIGFPGGAASAAYGINERDEVVGAGLDKFGQSRAFLYRQGSLTDLNDTLAPGSGWVLEKARAINNKGEIVGNGRLNGQVRAFKLVPAIEAGLPVPIPAGAVGMAPEVTILRQPDGYQGTNFLWSAADGRLYAVAGDFSARLSWRTSTTLTDPGRVVSFVNTVWPRDYQRHVVGAPVDMAPQGSSGSSLKFYQLVYSDRQGSGVDAATHTFNASQSGWTVLQYLVTNGGPLDPQNQHSLFKVIRSAEWNDGTVFARETHDAEIGKAILAPNGAATINVALPGPANDFQLVGRSVGEQLNGLTLDLSNDVSLASAQAVSSYDPTNRHVTVRIQNGQTTASTVLSSLGQIGELAPQFEALPANGEDPSGVVNLPGALNLDGSGSHVEVPAGVWFSGPFTIEAWVNPHSIQSWCRLIDFGNGQANNNVLVGLSEVTSGRPSMVVFIDGNPTGVSSTKSLPLNQWSHLAATFDGVTGRIYVNGELVGSGALPVPKSVIRSVNLIGKSPWPVDAPTDAAIHDLRVWQLARSPEQILAAMSQGSPNADPGLLGSWSLREGSGSAVRDGVSGFASPILGAVGWLPFPYSARSAGGRLAHEDVDGLNGFVLYANAFYDGSGQDRAHDRATRLGPILPVNKPTELTVRATNQLVVVWYRRDNLGVSWPVTPVLYSPTWPSDPDRIIISAQAGSPQFSEAGYPARRLYNQPDPSQPGFNPNEEHALIVDDRVCALRDDLNGAGPGRLNLSEAYVLLKYRNPFSQEWQMKVFSVINSDAQHPFSYPAQAGSEIIPPFPLDTLLTCGSSLALEGPVWRDYKGKFYAMAAGTGNSPARAVLKYFYPMQAEFYLPANSRGPSAAPGDCIPWLPGYTANGTDPISVTNVIRWPIEIPTLQVGSTLMNANNGLPEIFGQARAEVLFEGVNPSTMAGGVVQRPKGYTQNSGVRLYDPLTERVVPLAPLTALPARLSTALEPGGSRKVFTQLPHVLRTRFLYDEAKRALVFRGFVVTKGQPPAEPLVLPNVMTEMERTNLVALVASDSQWAARVNALFDLTRNPNKVDLDHDSQPDRRLLIGLTTLYEVRTNGSQVSSFITQDPTGVPGVRILSTGATFESLGSGPKALTAALPLSDAAASQLLVKGADTALRFDGLDDAVTLSALQGLNSAPQAFTAEAWISVDRFPTNQATVLRLGDGASTSDSWVLGNKGVIRFGNGGPSATLSLNTWVHLAVAFDGSTYRAYVDGIQVGTPVARGSISLAGPSLTLAPDVAKQDRFAGRVDEVRIWALARSQSELQHNKSQTLRGNERGLVLYWRCDEGSGVSVADESGSDNVGTLAGSPAWSVPADGASGFNTPVREPNGYVTLAFNNDPNLPGLPVTLKVIRIDCSQGLYTGGLHVLPSDNVFDERLTLRHPGDFGFEPEKFDFEWAYHRGGENVPLPGASLQADTNDWRAGVHGAGYQQVTLGQGGESSVLVISDNRWLMRYRPNPEQNFLAKVCGTNWTDWIGAPGVVPPEAQLAEGWIKRVTQVLNPFDARTSDFRNSAVNTFASLLVSAGRRYEGDIAFNPDADNINKVGLIETYETTLRRGRSLSIDNNIQDSAANDALLLATSKIASLYTALGNEAFADAEDPTIGFTTPDAEVGTLAPSIFAFQNQLDSLLDEELALLRGQDQSHGAPVYNRLLWNFTHGDGQVAYQQVYNIQDTETRDPVSGAVLPADGFIDASDAATLYPQGHGDAWGHYLTALTGYYALLQHTNFNWVPRTESVLLAGVPVDVDYQDERTFATIAAALAKAGEHIVGLTYRQSYVDDPAGQWQGYKDTDEQRGWGVIEWGRRAGQSAYFNWLVANAILPAVDPNPTHQGLQKIDRTTVPELRQIASEYSAIQSQLDSADTGLNPLGLAKGALVFDIDPAFFTIGSGIQGQTHFDQIYQRSLKAMGNAVAVFNHANDLTRNLRRTQDSVSDYSKNVSDQERDYNNRLIEIFGYPYSGDMGPGKPYASTYSGPDLLYFNYVDQTELTGKTGDLLKPNQIITAFVNSTSDQIRVTPDSAIAGAVTIPVAYPLSSSPVWPFTVTPGSKGTRRAVGALQMAVSDILQSHAGLAQGLAEYDALLGDISQAVALLRAKYAVQDDNLKLMRKQRDAIVSMNAFIGTLYGVRSAVEHAAQSVRDQADNFADSLPKVAGVAFDPSFIPRGVTKSVAGFVAKGMQSIEFSASIAENSLTLAKEIVPLETDINIAVNDDRYEVKQMAAEIQSMVRQEAPKRVALAGLRENLAQQMANYYSRLAEGVRLLDERDAYRRRVSGAVSQNRYRDMTFRIFRNDAIQKYRAAFDVASRYVFLAATAYDYETTLLGDQQGSGRAFLTDIVRQRALGEWVDGVPIVGRHGLGDSLARLGANWDVLKTQLGINNPQHEDGYFSLRRELFRQKDSSDEAWRRTLLDHRVENLWSIPEFRRYCRPFAPEAAGAQPGVVIPFATTITPGLNYFGFPLAAQDGSYDASRFATKIRSTAIVFDGYPTTLARTPQVYLVPVGTDILRAARGDTTATREFKIVDQRIPVPYPIGFNDLNNPSWIPANDSLEGSFIDVRRYSSFRASTLGVDAFDPEGGEGATTESRLVGRSVWNTQWLLIIPGSSLLADPGQGLDELVNNATDITLYFRTYSFSGN